MSQSREPQRNKGKVSKTKNKVRKTGETQQDKELRDKVKRAYITIVAACGVLIIVFAFLVANKLTKAGVILEPEEAGQIIASVPFDEIDESENTTHEKSKPTKQTKTGPTQTDVSETSASAVNTVVADARPAVRRTYSYGNVNIEGGLEVVVTTATDSTPQKSTTVITESNLSGNKDTDTNPTVEDDEGNTNSTTETTAAPTETEASATAEATTKADNDAAAPDPGSSADGGEPEAGSSDNAENPGDGS